jgi:hypothetical protein
MNADLTFVCVSPLAISFPALKEASFKRRAPSISLRLCGWTAYAARIKDPANLFA